jgi:heme O synthase-like polyprenyltransferase
VGRGDRPDRGAGAHPVRHRLLLDAAALLGSRAALNLIREKTGAAARVAYKFSTAYLAFLFMAMILDKLLL